MRNNCFRGSHHGVSHILGYMLSLLITVVVIASVSLTTYTLINQQKEKAADIMAENIANRVVDDVVNMCITKEQYPDANCEIKMDLPRLLVDEYSYYVQLFNDKVVVASNYINAYAESSIYNYSNKLQINLIGKVYSSSSFKLRCEPFDYEYKFDFGTNRSSSSPGYTRLSQYSTDTGVSWPSGTENYKYRTKINILNPLGVYLPGYYQVLIQLNEKNFNYDNAEPDGKDINFYYEADKLPFWIETWNSPETHTSRIWVNITDIPATGKTIYIYYGNQNVVTSASNGEKTFLFFDDFTDPVLDSTKWSSYLPNNIYFLNNDAIVLSNGAAICSLNNFSSSPCVYEAKVKSTSAIKEAGLFTKYTSDVTPYPYYKNSYLFLSGGYESPDSENNLSILTWSSGVWKILAYDQNKPSIGEDWHRLQYLLSNSEHIVSRYHYSNFTLEGYVTKEDTTYSGEGKFGLCTISDDSIAMYDWVFVRRYIDYTSYGDEDDYRREITSQIMQTESNGVFDWQGPCLSTIFQSDFSGIDNDFIYSGSDSGIFEVSGLEPDESYSITFTVGDRRPSDQGGRIIENMTIKINNDPDSVIQVTCTDSQPVKKYTVSATPSASGKLTFKFYDTDTDYYWAICGMTIQEGDREIELTGG